MELVKLIDIHENQPKIYGNPIDPITFEPLNRESSIRIDGNPPTKWLHYNPKTIKRLLTDTCMCGYPGINYVSDHLSGEISTFDLEEFKSALKEKYTHNVIHGIPTHPDHLRHVDGDYIYKSPVTHTKYTEDDAERMFPIIEDRTYPHLRGTLKRTKKKKPKKTKQKKKPKKTKNKKKRIKKKRV